MTINKARDEKGLSLMELLIGIVFCGMLVAGTCWVFVGQGKAYAVQE